MIHRSKGFYLTAFALVCSSLVSLQGCIPAAVVGGATGAAIVATDRRSSSVFMEDKRIMLDTNNAIKEQFGSNTNVPITSYNRIVLLTGQVPSQEIKDKVTHIAKSITGVRHVVNETRVTHPSSFSERSNDTGITSLVKTRMTTNGIAPSLVKVVTELNTVYLLGLVTQQEASKATDIARNTQGVNKVVKVFEYISESDAKKLDMNRDDNASKNKKPITPGNYAPNPADY